MIRRPPSSPPFPYPTLFRSPSVLVIDRLEALRARLGHRVRHGVEERNEIRRAALTRRHAQLHERPRSEEHTSELQSLAYLVCRLLLEKKKTKAEHPTAEAFT